METNEKSFRYTYMFRNLGTFYLIFLVIVIIISLFGKDFVFFICDGVMVAGGLIFATWYLTTQVKVSDFGIATKTILGSKSLRWSEINRFSARGSSTRLHRHDESIVLTIGYRLDSYAEIFELLHQKRPDLFDFEKYKSFTHNRSNAIVQLAIGIFLVVLGLFGYFTGNEALISTLIFGLIFALVSFRSWYSSPRALTLEQESLNFSYVNKIVSLPINEITDIKIGREQQVKSVQVNSVLVFLKNGSVLMLSSYDQSAIVMYYVLKQWHKKYGTGIQTNPA